MQDNVVDVEVSQLLDGPCEVVRNLSWRLVAKVAWCHGSGSEGCENNEEVEEHEKEILRDYGQFDVTLRDHAL